MQADVLLLLFPQTNGLYRRKPGFELYYCLNPDQDEDLEYYTDPDINPRAGDTQSGFASFGGYGTCTSSW